MESKRKASPKDEENAWITATLTLLSTNTLNTAIVTADAEMYLPSKNADYGVITDLDDTILQSYVTSRFKLKML